MKRIAMLLGMCLLVLPGCRQSWQARTQRTLADLIASNAAWAMAQEPETVTAYPCERSEGGVHDFYSEGDYWWPDPENPDGPYIRRDGMTNPQNFTAHRLAMIRLSKVVGYLASAYIATGDEAYAAHAWRHVEAWFLDPETLMNPSLTFAQAIKGITPGRGIGIIDTIHLMEVAQGILRMQDAACVEPEKLERVKQWFRDYTAWLITSENGQQEMNTKNNHATCWVMQVASFARLTGDGETLALCRQRYKEHLLPGQMAEDGSFPLEVGRTKPYGYSLFNLDAMASVCQIASEPGDDLWEFSTPDGRNIRLGIDFMKPFIRDKSTWPHPPDVMYWDAWPIAHPALLFAAVAFGHAPYFDLWASLDHVIAEGEVERNVPIRNPLIWIPSDK